MAIVCVCVWAEWGKLNLLTVFPLSSEYSVTQLQYTVHPMDPILNILNLALPLTLLRKSIQNIIPSQSTPTAA